MNKITIWLILTCILVAALLLVSCAPVVFEEKGVTIQIDGDIIVTSTLDDGPGTLHQALLDAESGDIIAFDPAVFPPSAPATIFLRAEDQVSSLPNMTQGNITIDASNVGVILDGSENSGASFNALEIYSVVTLSEAYRL